MDTTEHRTELALDQGGLWAIRSTSQTVVYVDLDRRLLLRDRRGASPALPYDGEWVPLVQVTSPRGDNTVRVGDRHEYLTDPGGGTHDYRWYIPEACTSIEPVESGDMPGGTHRPAP